MQENLLSLDVHCLVGHRVKVDRYQRRLEASVAASGIRLPIAVQPAGDGTYSILDGARRLAAACACGMTSVPCRIVTKADLPTLDGTMFDQAERLRELLDHRGWTQQEAANLLGVSQSTIANKLRLLQFAPDERESIVAAGLTERHARAVLTLPKLRRRDALDRIIREGMTVASAETMVDDLRKLPPPSRGAIRDIGIFYNSIDHALGILHNAGVTATLTREETDKGAKVTICVTR